MVAPKPEIIPPELIPVDPAPPQPPRIKSRSRSAAKVLPPKPQSVPPQLIPVDPAASAAFPFPLRNTSPTPHYNLVTRSESPKAKQELAREIARKVLNRSRSRGDVPDLLPVEEEEVEVRGRQMKPEGPLAKKAKELLKKQERASSVVIGEELGKFGRNFKFHFNQRLKNIERSASVPPPPTKTKTYDDIRQEIEQSIPEPSAVDTKIRKKVQFPKDAFFPGKE